MAPDVHAIVFSKDRALQVDLLLRSVADHLRGASLQLTVLFRASDPGFAEGYRRVADLHAGMAVRWVEESAFRDDVLAAVAAAPCRALMFLVDDDVIFRPVDLAPLLHAFGPRHLFVSLRADRSYPAHRPPRFRVRPTHLQWIWHDFGRPTVWNYPFSVDGNLFHPGDVRRLLATLDFRAPNSLEGAMDGKRHAPRFSLWRPLALAPPAAVLFNNPLNKVQTEGETWHAGTDPAELNRALLSGRRIDPRPCYDATPDSTHFAVPVTLR